MEQISLFEIQTIEEPTYTLDPCPKCGKVPYMRNEIDTRGMIDSLKSWKGGLGERFEPTGKQTYAFDCKTCYIPDPGANAFTYNVFFTPEEAAEHWHQRVKEIPTWTES